MTKVEINNLQREMDDGTIAEEQESHMKRHIYILIIRSFCL